MSLCVPEDMALLRDLILVLRYSGSPGSDFLCCPETKLQPESNALASYFRKIRPSMQLRWETETGVQL